jgi:hypothetical protein
LSESASRESQPATVRPVSDRYRERWHTHDVARARAADRSRRLSTVRGATFLAGVGMLVAVDFLEGPGERAALALLVLVVATFIAQVVVHRRIRAEERWEGALASIAREGMLRLERRWRELDEALPPAEREPPDVPGDHAYAADLDVVGRASLWRLLGPVTSVRAHDLLAGWLLEPGVPDTARARQDAVRELAPEAELRAHFTALGRLDTPDTLGSWGRFLDWADAAPDFASRPTLRGAAFLLPPLLLAAVLGDVLLGFGPWWLLVALPQIAVVRTSGRLAEPSFAAAASAASPARGVVPQLRLLDGTEWDAPVLRDARERLGRGSDAAHARLGSLLRWLDTVESRRNIVYATLSPVLLLDLHLAMALDRWRVRHGPEVRAWLDASAEWEALGALSTLAHDHPGWCYPELSGEAPPRVVATGLGHPLLPPDRCVPNDVSLGPPGRFLLVTGSNMSGKSTLLRALGLNAVLAGAGAPVCARSLSIPCMRVFTCMRVDDSLEEGVSLFMAELLRIRSVVEEARAPDELGRPVLYLLDEMLHGTNTAERRVAARGVVRHLLDAGALGAVSTHDLALAETPELLEAAHAVHFREEVAGGSSGRPRITFDYRLREGIATTRNALKLLEAVGLSLPDDLSGDAR